MAEARLIVAMLFLAATAALGVDSRSHCRPLLSCFLGPAATAGSVTRFRAASAAEPASQQRQQHQGSTSNIETSPLSPLARRLLLRRALARSNVRTGRGSSSQVSTPSSSRTATDVGNLFRLEVAQRIKEMKLMTQPGVGPLAPAAGPGAISAAASFAETLPAKKLEGDAASLEHQISLLSARIKSIADHLKTTPTDAVSRKGLVVLVKRRRRLLETLKHRDNARYEITTDALGLRQRPDAPTKAGEQLMPAARREKRRARGRRRRREEVEAGRWR